MNRDTTNQAIGRTRRAVLVFADSIVLDLRRRRWPLELRLFLEPPRLDPDATAGADVHFFTRTPGDVRASRLTGAQIHLQRGGSFADRLENALESLARLGYRQVAVVGCDCPELEASDVRKAFEQLGSHRLVLGPDHGGGVYLIALRLEDRRLLEGIHWQKNRDCRALQARFGAAETCLLDVKHDLDGLRDLWLLCRSSRYWRRMARLLLERQESSLPGKDLPRVDLIPPQERRRWQRPPPSSIHPAGSSSP